MTNSLNELSDVYLSQVAEQEESDNTPENVKVRVLQIVKAIRYKAKKEGGNLVKAFNDYMGGQSGVGAAERQMVKQRLGLSEEVGITSTEKMQKALKDAQLKKKEDEAVTKAKNIKKEEVVNEIIDPKGARRQDAAKPKKETPLTPEQKAKRDKANKQFDKEYYRPNPQEYPTMWKKREESYSNWREDLREIVQQPETDKEMDVKIKEKKVKNKVVINPPMQEEIKKMGGEILEMTEVEEQGSLVGLSPQEVTTMKRRALLEVRLSKLRQRSLSKVKPEEDDVKKEDYETQKTAEVLGALKKKKKDFTKRYGKMGPDVMLDVAKKTVKRKGDTSKSDDRYAYEEVQVEAKVDTGKSADEKATARNLRNTPPGADKDTDLKTFITRKPGESLDSARSRVRQRKHAAKRGVKEDKAFDNVVSALRKKHGESGVLTKDSPKPKTKPLDAKQIWKRDAVDAAERERRAQYGITPWNKKGSLGT